MDINFRAEYMLMIRRKILEAINNNVKSIYINGKLEPFAFAELLKDGYKVDYSEFETNIICTIDEHTAISWNYDHLNK